MTVNFFNDDASKIYVEFIQNIDSKNIERIITILFISQEDVNFRDSFNE